MPENNEGQTESPCQRDEHGDPMPEEGDLEYWCDLESSADSQDYRRSSIANDISILRSEGRLIEDKQEAIRWAVGMHQACNLVAQPTAYYLEGQKQIHRCADRLRNRLARLDCPGGSSAICDLPDEQIIQATVLLDEAPHFLNQVRSVFGSKALLEFDVPPRKSVQDRQEWQLTFLADWKPRSPEALAQMIAIDPDCSSKEIDEWVSRQQHQAVLGYYRPTWELLFDLSVDGLVDDWMDRFFAHQCFLHATEEALVTANKIGRSCLALFANTNLEAGLRNHAKTLIEFLQELHRETRELRNIPRPKIHD